MKDDKAVTKGDTYHRLRTKLAMLRNTIRNTHNPVLKLKLRRDEQSLIAQCDMARGSRDAS